MRAPFATLLLPFLVSGCLPGGFFTSKKSPSEGASGTSAMVSTEKDGLVTGRLDPNASGTQTLDASGNSAIAGASIAFPPGSIALETDISLEEGADILSDGVLASLGIAGGDVSAAGNAVLLESSVAQDATAPFTVSILTSTTATLSMLQSGELAILYKVIKNDQGGQLFVGFIPPSEIKIDGNKLIFATKYFGSYQAVNVKTDVTKIVEKPTTEPLVGRSDVGKLEPGQLATVFRDLKSGTKYFWKVEAIDASGNVVGLSDTWEFTTK